MTATTLLTDEDLYLFNEGTHLRLYNKLGAHPLVVEGTTGTYFAVWAPHVQRVSVLGDFNSWDKDRHRLRRRGQSGIWEGFVAGAEPGARYKYFLASPDDQYAADKADPLAFRSEVPPQTASVICQLDYRWSDQAWMQQRSEGAGPDRPLAIYQMHLGSWRRHGDGRYYSYRELAAPLADYVRQTGFTHVQLLPVMEHCRDESWGYETSGYFAPTGRYGTPQDFMYLVDYLHQQQIGVILDWAPAHLAPEAHALSRFDGTFLYEQDPQQEGKRAGLFNYARREVRSFLFSSARFWLDKFHADGLRLDSLETLLYRDYRPQAEDWVPSEHLAQEDLEAVAFLQGLNEQIHRDYPGVITIAEEATCWPMVSWPVQAAGGLGFDFQWDVAWTRDTLDYMHCDADGRQERHHQVTSHASDAFSENVVLPLSHRQVAPGQGSLLEQMPGNDWQKMANLRLLLGYTYSQPGKKLLFMGGEFGQRREWQHYEPLDWQLLQFAPHAELQTWVQDLNRVYRSEPALYEFDRDTEGFEWIDPHDDVHSVLSFFRKGRQPERYVVAVCNFSPVPRRQYRVGVPAESFWKEMLNSDATAYGGSGFGNLGGIQAEAVPCHDRPYSILLTLPPLAIVVFQNEEPQ